MEKREEQRSPAGAAAEEAPPANLFGRYDVLRELGRGAQSVVYLVRDRENQGALKAAKILKPDVLETQSAQVLVSEFHLLESIDHENLVRVFDFRMLPGPSAESKPRPVLICEYVEESRSLEDLLRAEEAPPLAVKLRLAYQMIAALDYLHRKNILHGDLKPSNILVAQDGNTAQVQAAPTPASTEVPSTTAPDAPRGALAPLGASTTHPPRSTSDTPGAPAPHSSRAALAQPGAGVPHSQRPILAQPGAASRARIIDFGVSQDLLVSRAKKRVGTPYYFAPEIAHGGLVQASDIYSLGVILYRLFVRSRLPYRGVKPTEIFQMHAEKRSLFRDEDFVGEGVSVPAEIVELIRQCLVFDPLERPRRLSQVLRELRFAFPDALADMPPPTTDTRLRQVLGMREAFARASTIIRNVAAGKIPERRLIFLAAPSGGGKSRMIHELEKLCQKENLASVQFTVSGADFWSAGLQRLARQYAHTKAARRMRSRIAMAERSPRAEQRMATTVRFLRLLATELGHLVLFIDGRGGLGLDDRISARDSEVLHRLAEGEGEGPGAAGVPLVTIAAVKTRAYVSESDVATTAPQDFARRMAELKDAFAKGREEGSVEGKSDPSESDNPRSSSLLPEQLRLAVLQGRAEVIDLPPWTQADLSVYLCEVFPDRDERDFTPDVLQAFSRLTRGSPGLVQAVCNDVLERRAREPQRDLAEHLLALARSAQVHDLQVYRLKYYDPAGLGLLACLAAMGEIPARRFSVFARTLFAQGGSEREATERARRVLVHAHDDGIVDVIQGEDGRLSAFRLPQGNVTLFLKRLACHRKGSVGVQLAAILEAPAVALLPRERFELAFFAGRHRESAELLVDLLRNEGFTDLRQALRPAVQEHREHMPSDVAADPIGPDLRLALDFEEVMMRLGDGNLRGARSLAETLLETIASRNDATANALRVRTQLVLGGTILRLLGELPEAIAMLDDVLESELVGDVDHHFALGLRNLCQAFRAEPGSTEETRALAIVEDARRDLLPLDRVRYATLSGSYAGFLEDRWKDGRGLGLLRATERIFREAGEPARRLRSLLSLGRGEYFLHHFDQARDTFQEALSYAEHHAMTHIAVEALGWLMRVAYVSGRIEEVTSLYLYMVDLSRRLNDFSGLLAMVEVVSRSYLEAGQMRRAEEVLGELCDHIDSRDPVRARRDFAMREIMLAQIREAMADFAAARRHLQAARTMLGADGGAKGRRATETILEAAQEVVDFIDCEVLAESVGVPAAMAKMQRYVDSHRFSPPVEREANVRLFHWAVAAGDAPRAEVLLEECAAVVPSLSPATRLQFALDEHALEQLRKRDAATAGTSGKALARALRLLTIVRSRLHRARALDAAAEEALGRGHIEVAWRRWQAASAEFDLYIRSWTEVEAARFRDQHPTYLHHRHLQAQLLRHAQAPTARHS